MASRGREVHPVDREGLGGYPSGPIQVRRPSWRAGDYFGWPGGVGRLFWKATRVQEGREGSGGPAGGPVFSRRSIRSAVRGWKVSRRAGRRGGPPGGPARVGRSFWRAGSVGRGSEVLPKGRERPGGPPRGPGGIGRTIWWYRQGLGGVGRPSQRAVRGWEAILEVQEGSRGPPRRPRGVERPSLRALRGWESPRRARRGEEALPAGREGQEALCKAGRGCEGSGVPPGWPEGLEGPPKGLGRVERPIQRARSHQEAHPEGCEGSGGFRRPTQRAVRGQEGS